MTPLRQRLVDDLKLRNYSPRTIEAYVAGVAKFAKHFGRAPDQFGPEELRAFQPLLERQRGVVRARPFARGFNVAAGRRIGTG